MITALEHSNASHVKKSHIWLWGAINYYIWNYTVKNIINVSVDKYSVYFPLENSI